jgi:hypothetical protein
LLRVLRVLRGEVILVLILSGNYYVKECRPLAFYKQPETLKGELALCLVFASSIGLLVGCS